jgi:hypothetical protein
MMMRYHQHNLRNGRRMLLSLNSSADFEVKRNCRSQILGCPCCPGGSSSCRDYHAYRARHHACLCDLNSTFKRTTRSARMPELFVDANPARGLMLGGDAAFISFQEASPQYGRTFEYPPPPTEFRARIGVAANGGRERVSMFGGAVAVGMAGSPDISMQATTGAF